jgi:outer membrane protein insertion porin family
MKLARRFGLKICLRLSLLITVVTITGIAVAQEPRPQNPFEAIPEAEETVPTKPAQEPQSPFETPEQQPEETQPTQIDDVIEAIEFRGSRRVPQATLRAMIFSKKGDRLDIDGLHRDFMALWNTGRFDDITLEREEGQFGWVVRFRLVERRVVRSIKYDGNKSIQVSEILDRFKERRVGLTVESQYDPNKVQHAVIVLREYLSERGRQFAVVDPQIRQIPPSSLELTFKITEGPKVKVGKLNIEGNEVFSDKVVRRSMANLKPIGIPHSILFESMFSKSFDSTKLEEDKERIRNFYQERGYFQAKAIGHDVNLRDTGGGGFKIPLIKPNKPGKKADVTISMEEGRQYHLNSVVFEGVKLFRTPQTLMRPLFQMDQGAVFSTKKLRDGMENMRKLYGEFGYIDMVAEPYFDFVPATDKVDMTLSVEEGDQFFVRRINFAGNTTTRDKVIRRELLIDEGDMFNTRLWEVSLLRLNQLGYFEVLKEEESAELRRDTRTNTVDITLNVKEKGRNSVHMTGGVSGIAGTFLGFGYATNNFLGLGETLSIDAQLGTRLRSVTFGFTEPYLFDRPIQSGFTIYTSHFDYDQGRELSILSGRNLRPLFDQLGQSNLLNYTTQGYGFTAFASYPLKRSFARVSLTYGYDSQDIEPLTDASREYFEYINFQGLDGPNSLVGIKTSRIVPAYTYNTVDHPITPSRGKSLFVSTSFAGLGGNVQMIAPTIDFKHFRKGLKAGHVIGLHAMGRLVTGYGGVAPPPFNRFYMGGENDIRGFDIWGISPVAWIPSSATVPVLNADGSSRQQKTVGENGTVAFQPVTQQVPVYQMIWPGGDISTVGNAEYRIPIFGPVTLALFADVGVNRIIFPSQLALNPGRLDGLNYTHPQAAFDGAAIINSETEKVRMSTGVEFQIMMPVVNAPFRFYWAYNPSRVNTFLQAPIVADRSYFPNAASFFANASRVGRAFPFVEDKSTFRFTVSRTF